MRVMIAPEQTLTILLCEKDGTLIDGELTVEFGPKALIVRTDWPDSSGRTGVIYEERFAKRSKLTARDYSQGTEAAPAATGIVVTPMFKRPKGLHEHGEVEKMVKIKKPKPRRDE